MNLMQGDPDWKSGPAHQLAYLLQQMESVMHGCSDGNCVMRPKHIPVGMHTNGGCKCLRDLPQLAFALAEHAEIYSHVYGMKNFWQALEEEK